MITLDIRIKEADMKRLQNAIDGVRSRARYWFSDFGGEMPKRGAEQYVNLIKVAILTERYAPYPPYSPRYEAWKNKYMGGHGFWYLKGDLFASVTHWLEGGAWAAGVPPGVTDTGGKSWLGKGDMGAPTEIEEYGLKVEYGIYSKGATKPRPLFQPAGEEIANTKWPQLAEEAMKDIERMWR